MPVVTWSLFLFLICYDTWQHGFHFAVGTQTHPWRLKEGWADTPHFIPAGYPLSTPGINAENVLGLADHHVQVGVNESPQHEPWYSANHMDTPILGPPPPLHFTAFRLWGPSRLPYPGSIDGNIYWSHAFLVCIPPSTQKMKMFVWQGAWDNQSCILNSPTQYPPLSLDKTYTLPT